LLGAAAAWVPLPAELVERRYSNLLYPVWQQLVTPLSDLLPFAAIDLLLIGVAGWLVVAAGQTFSMGRTSGWVLAASSLLVRIATVAAAFYLAFLLSWGFNYRRVPLPLKLRYEPGAVTQERLRELADITVRDVNDLHGRAHAALAGGSLPDDSLLEAFARAQRRVRVGRPAVPARPKKTLLDVYFRAAGVDGMTDPYFLETLVASDLLSFERPFVVAHEWSHLAGFADEGEANFVGWMTCMNASDAARYSAALFLYTQLSPSLSDEDRKEIAGRLASGPRSDLRAMAERMRRNVRPIVANAGWRVYDRYLKANRIEAGTASYGEVVRLILGVQLEDGGRK
jgi:hypothetical protein